MEPQQAHVQTALILAGLLQRLEASSRPVDAGQYQHVVQRLQDLLRHDSVDWTPVLERSPSAAQIYENLHYPAAGLCRSPLEAATRSELAARRLIESIRRLPPTGSPRVVRANDC